MYRVGGKFRNRYHVTANSYLKKRVQAVLVNSAIPPICRIFRADSPNPLATLPSNTRFGSERSNFTVLYAAQDFSTAFVEVIVRDRFSRTNNREVAFIEVASRSISLLTSKLLNPLSLIDLRKDGCVRLGAPMDAVNARNHSAGRALGQDIHANHVGVDGFIFSSRLTGGDVYAIFDRSISKLKVISVDSLITHNMFLDATSYYEINMPMPDD